MRQAALPPTIRSRCRALDLAPLGPADLTAAVTAAGGDAEAGMALAALSGGSPGEALRLAAVDGAALYARLVDLLADAPTLDRAKLMALVAEAEGRDAAERAATLSRLTALLLQRLARAGATGPAGRRPRGRAGRSRAGRPPRPRSRRRAPLGRTRRRHPAHRRRGGGAQP
jgi:DNA polymerase-3 subunit delta'